MSAVAIIVGVDDYPDQPLTSAVRDALAFKDALLDLDLVKENEVTLLTALQQDGGRLATRDEITQALLQPYLHGDDVDRLYVYFSGHGMLVATNAPHTEASTAFLPSDISDPMSQSYKLLDVDDLQESFHTAGPREQFFFIDACRDLVYSEYPPQLSPVGLNGRKQPPVGSRAQGVLFAVSPGGQALGRKDGLGVMTAHLLSALRGEGEALDYDDAFDSYVVTFHSVHAYVKARIEEQIVKLADWKRQYMVPEPRSAGELSPVRLVRHPDPASLTLTVDPPNDAEYVHVNLVQRGSKLLVPQWPPEQFGQPVQVPRQRFRLMAGSNVGATGVEPELIDARVVSTAVIKHKYIGILGPGPTLPPGPVPPPADPGLGPAAVAYSEALSIADRELPVAEFNAFIRPRPRGRLDVAAAEPWASADITGLDPPYATEPVGPLRGEVAELVLPTGAYRVRFRVGGEEFSEAVAEVVDGRAPTTVRATAALSPLVSSLLGMTAHAESVSFDASDSPVQANPALYLATMTALGLPASGGELSLVVALDGSRRQLPAREILAGMAAEVRSVAWGQGEPVRSASEDWPSATAGSGQVFTGIVPLPGRNSTLVLRSDALGQVELALAADLRLTTSVAIVFGADGGIDVAQSLAPGWQSPAEAASYARRSLLGQWFYRSGELTSRGVGGAPDELRGILTGEEVDPVLSVMAFHSWRRAAGQGHFFADRVGTQLIEAYPQNADSAIIAALLDRDASLARLAYAGVAPVLAESARAAVIALGDSDSPLTTAVRQIRPDSVWALRWTQPDRPAVDEAVDVGS